MIKPRVDKATKRWIKNRSDELAVEAGCWFDEENAAHVCLFFENELRLYEGEYAGEPFHLIDWQRDLLSRAFGWMRHSKDWDRPIRRFRKVSVWVPKKNGKSPLAAGVGLYLLVMDGEAGQKVFSAAKDGKQAQIVHTHARQMVTRSPYLSQRCVINKSTGRIAFEQMSSIYDVLSSDNIDGQEGLNGSVVIDETHVVDDRLVKVLEHMGASRSEPLQFEVSTAGNNPEGYGRRQWDYGRQIERGDVVDQEFLFVSYGVEPTATDEECEDPRAWKACNPSWGVTIKPTEFEDSARRARQKGLAEWRSFCMYRLNKWLAGAAPWLGDGEWARQTLPKPDDLTVAAAGLDLSKTRDMSALNLTWKYGDDQFYQQCWLWITEEYAETNRSKVRFDEWAAKDYLRIIPGDVIRTSWIKEAFESLADEIYCLVYDKTYAQEFSEWVEEQHPQIDLIEFPQSPAFMEGPIDTYQAALRDGTLWHNDNPCMTWQAGHCETKENAKGHRILVKPKRDDVRKIDGLVASVMGLYGALQLPEVVSAADLLMY